MRASCGEKVSVANNRIGKAIEVAGTALDDLRRKVSNINELVLIS
jgi:hypothetical protein